MSSIEEEIKAYVSNAVAHASATEDGDANRANKAHDSLIQAYRNLNVFGLEGLRALLPLMEHENEGVRNWAATHCLELDEPKAKAVLLDLAKGDSLTSFSAEMVLSEWNQGALEVPK